MFNWQYLSLSSTCSAIGPSSLHPDLNQAAKLTTLMVRPQFQGAKPPKNQMDAIPDSKRWAVAFPPDFCKSLHPPRNILEV